MLDTWLGTPPIKVELIIMFWIISFYSYNLFIGNNLDPEFKLTLYQRDYQMFSLKSKELENAFKGE